jgi:hypothetical protein
MYSAGDLDSGHMEFAEAVNSICFHWRHAIGRKVASSINFTADLQIHARNQVAMYPR